IQLHGSRARPARRSLKATQIRSRESAPRAVLRCFHVELQRLAECDDWPSTADPVGARRRVVQTESPAAAAMRKCVEHRTSIGRINEQVLDTGGGKLRVLTRPRISAIQ